MKRILWIVASIMVFIAASVLLLNKRPLNDEDTTNIESSSNSSAEYDAFRDPNVLWESEDEFYWEFKYPSGSVVVSRGLTDLMSGANETNMVALTIELMNICEFHPVDINNLLIPDSLADDDYLLECVQLFNKADNLNRCTELYHAARMYVEDTVSTEEYLSYYYSGKPLMQSGFEADLLNLALFQFMMKNLPTGGKSQLINF